jgi:hypothetical protein
MIYHLDYNFQFKFHTLSITSSRCPLPQNFPEKQEITISGLRKFTISTIYLKVVKSFVPTIRKHEVNACKLSLASLEARE